MEIWRGMLLPAKNRIFTHYSVSRLYLGSCELFISSWEYSAAADSSRIGEADRLYQQISNIKL